jgi:DnaD/phage-associated family protein
MIPALGEGSTIIQRTLDEGSTNTRRTFAPNRIEKNRIEKNKKEEEEAEEKTEESVDIKNDGKVKEEKPATATSNWITEYESNIGLITPMVIEEVESYELSDEVVIEAIKEAVRSGVRMPKYICRILEDFKANNIKTRADVEARRIERSSRLHNKDKPTSAYVNPVQIQNEYGDLDRFYANRD